MLTHFSLDQKLSIIALNRKVHRPLNLLLFLSLLFPMIFKSPPIRVGKGLLTPFWGQHMNTLECAAHKGLGAAPLATGGQTACARRLDRHRWLDLLDQAVKPS